MEKLGIEPGLLLAQIINFFIIIFVLTKLLYQPILKLLEKRRREIQSGLELTEKMRLEDEKLAEKRSKLLETARQEAQDILREARRQAKDEEKQILAAAQTEAKRIAENGKKEIVKSREEMEQEVRRYAADLAVAMAKKLLTVSLGPADREKILTSHIKDLESVKIEKTV